ncbi:ABC transporter ATP-binding protein [Vaginisenegalia massiliensis]|uniref:ABC transporter ATP-binding protein n=1 Tax=Vaginisenegalia massiliensis TaxID=2058294 RepID=UPI000F53F6B0|nr:sn-glycerol-3-phosphate ABC transporter ATP-binding protein UgpC [Vaginisenegalia massiliensis]
MSTIRIEHLYKEYANGARAVTDFNLEIKDKEFVVLVGPSGCGKSTTLRMLAGLEDITTGNIYIDDALQNNLHPKDRDIAMVFQNYALYPHMTVRENMAFGLKMKKLMSESIQQRVEEVAATIGLTAYLDRLPKELSGGQRQRVALGRAIVRQAKVFLMDEPLSNLDAKLRGQTRAEIIQLNRNLGITTVYVTHDQVEAMTMADRIVIMNQGLIQQVGTPRELYLKPANKFVASFMGSPAMNFIEGVVTEHGLEVGDQLILLPDAILKELEQKGYLLKGVILGIRPENILYQDQIPQGYQNYHFKAKNRLAEMLSGETLLHFNIADQAMIAKVFTIDPFVYDQELKLCFDFNQIHFFDQDTEKAIPLDLTRLADGGDSLAKATELES